VKMETTESLAAEVPFYQTARRHLPENRNLYMHSLEIQNFHIQNSYSLKVLKINFASVHILLNVLAKSWLLKVSNKCSVHLAYYKSGC
jgi:hypothetical protein